MVPQHRMYSAVIVSPCIFDTNKSSSSTDKETQGLSFANLEPLPIDIPWDQVTKENLRRSFELFLISHQYVDLSAMFNTLIRVR